MAALKLGQPRHGNRHVARSAVVARADDHAVVRVVADGRSHRAPLQTETGNEAEPDATRPVMSLEHRDSRDVDARIARVDDECLGHQATRRDSDDAGTS